MSKPQLVQIVEAHFTVEEMDGFPRWRCKRCGHVFNIRTNIAPEQVQIVEALAIMSALIKHLEWWLN